MPTSAFIPSPSNNGFSLGPLYFHAYGICYVFAVAAAIYISRRRWAQRGGDPDIVYNVAWWGFPAGLVGGRIYFDITTPSQMPHQWWGPFAIWDGGLGIWGGIGLGAATGVWYLRRHLDWPDVYRFINAATPGLLVAQSIGRIGNYFNQELFGKPSTLPWALKVSVAHRPAGYAQYATFQPTFLYEIIWNLLLAATLVWLDNRRKVRPPGLFALYVAGYSAFRIFEETLRIDYSQHILGMRLNFWVALIGTVGGLLWFARVQFKRRADGSAEPPDPSTLAYSRSGTA
ncbi:MAG TPA: prolipoprotein diacylglyceryl transferase [Solirubrobacteraceae bacterium]|nr:prolipoprotein diacylglyceryl transferase [Solirubrobacteraceae bacterium]